VSYNLGMSGSGALLREGDLTGESYTQKAQRNRKNCGEYGKPA